MLLAERIGDRDRKGIETLCVVRDTDISLQTITIGDTGGITTRSRTPLTGAGILGKEALTGTAALMDMEGIAVMDGMACIPAVNSPHLTYNSSFLRNWQTGPRMATNSLSCWTITRTVSTFPALV